MQIQQKKWTAGTGWSCTDPALEQEADLVLAFGGTEVFRSPDRFAELQTSYPNALLVGCSTAGEIMDTRVCDDSLAVTAVAFDATRVAANYGEVSRADESFAAGRQLAADLDHQDLRHVFVLSDGLEINGSELAAGLSSALPESVSITGGLSGDGDRFTETYVLIAGRPKRNHVSIVGFYGKQLKIGYGSLGGWDPFGPERVITKSKGNVLYELDGNSALELYKKYLGDQAKDLPASGLRFPLALRSSQEAAPLVRTILAIDEETQSMTFAGDVPEGYYARLMKANFNRLIDGAQGAAQSSLQQLTNSQPELAVLISCVGRKIVLQQRIEEEVEAVREVLGDQTVMSGFYSYGEISPLLPSSRCALHNQTMTITTFSER